MLKINSQTLSIQPFCDSLSEIFTYFREIFVRMTIILSFQTQKETRFLSEINQRNRVSSKLFRKVRVYCIWNL